MTNQPTIGVKYNSTPVQVEATRKWQKFINVNPDGKFGPKTEAATKAYQKAHGLTADGVVGKGTWATVPDSPITSKATPTQQQIAQQNAAKTAVETIKQVAAAKQPAPTTPKPLNIPIPEPVARATTAAAKKVVETAGAAKQQVLRAKVIYKEQPMYIRIVVSAAAALAAIAGYETFKRRKAA